MPFKDVFELRNFTNTILHAMRRSQPTSASVREIRVPSVSHDVAGDVEIYAPDIKRMVESSGMPFFTVEYRLAPKLPGGVAAEEVFHGLRHVSAHAVAWDVDAVRIVLMGDSPSGGIAAGAALLASDRGLVMSPLLLWKTNGNLITWRAVLGEKAGRPESEVPLNVAPGRAVVEGLLGQLKTYVGVVGLDLFRNECMGRLARADVEVLLTGRLVQHSICFAGVTSTVLTMFRVLSRGHDRCRQQQPIFIRSSTQSQAVAVVLD
ncbi:alpha/beta hydrolase fold-3 domain-containing protein [Colletotrichum graminicola M1.001]|uniref:Alpha/beta hydrolase fold-3 domain-containing protein n=1 Tax=Colletotrichum graminicola (strain M1.001 / M2 / FGSC 10212) TaxID=645133 RepID=E3QZD5_COLGM|nr:alpha/beta hydrolase fold-3 domain-containing protein [Colletotrichum graminicola M1.001]EFQ36223.1 alpha/beta hydrolase fold-3 domain-containing protein [Colletotrichum graminicola M1.001]